MEFTGRYVIPAQPDTVWAALNDPEVLRASIPGCEALTKEDPTTFTGSVKIKIGPMSATFRGKVIFAELDLPRRCIIKGEGQGGVAGFARGQAEILLDPQDDGTILSYKAEASVGGKLAQVGQRLIDGAAKQIADEFFAGLTANIAASQARPDTSAPQEKPATAEGTDAARREGLVPEIWVVGLITIVVILIVLFGLVL